MIDQYGEDATFQAAQRADALIEAGDSEGIQTWRRIKTAIKALESEGAGESRH